MDDLYRAEILEHYYHPHHAGHLAAPDAAAEGYNPLCGDRIRIELGIADQTIREVAIEPVGCAISGAAASLLADTLVGMPVRQAEAMPAAAALELLGIEISPARLHCALLAYETVIRALARRAEKP